MGGARTARTARGGGRTARTISPGAASPPASLPGAVAWAVTIDTWVAATGGGAGSTDQAPVHRTVVAAPHPARAYQSGTAGYRPRRCDRGCATARAAGRRAPAASHRNERPACTDASVRRVRTVLRPVGRANARSVGTEGCTARACGVRLRVTARPASAYPRRTEGPARARTGAGRGGRCVACDASARVCAAASRVATRATSDSSSTPRSARAAAGPDLTPRPAHPAAGPGLAARTTVRAGLAPRSARATACARLTPRSSCANARTGLAPRSVRAPAAGHSELVRAVSKNAVATDARERRASSEYEHDRAHYQLPLNCSVPGPRPTFVPEPLVDSGLAVNHSAAAPASPAAPTMNVTVETLPAD